MDDIIKIPAHPNNYTGGRNKKIEYIVIHYTANNGDTAVGNGNYFAKPNRNASAHYFVDENNIVQSVSDASTAWHCGAKTYKHLKCRNNNSIGIEMCSEKDKNGKYYINVATKNLALKLTKELMAKYNIPVQNVIRHYDVTGKLCPEPFVRNKSEWLEFKQKLNVSEEVDEMNVYKHFEDLPEWGKNTIEKLILKKALYGNDKGELNISEDALKIYVVNDRMGLYGD